MIDGAVAAGVLVYNAGEDLARCVDSLRALFPVERIFVTDNASSDDAASLLPPEIRVSRNATNIGYCAGMNALLRWAKREGAEFLLSINPDATIDERSVRVLLDACGEQRVALAHPKILRRDSGVLDGAYGEITWRHLAVRMLGEGVADAPRWDKRKFVPFGHGACFVARIDAVFAVGGYAEEFFAYQDEAELGRRLAAAGWRIVYEPRARAYHHGPWGNTDREHLKKYFLARNSVLLLKNTAGGITR
ncbi:MAG: glycosyltransferase [Deltaproteobacteria bacterium]|nr:glycosyltransferase [Deltaproteobacteria bacterium]